MMLFGKHIWRGESRRFYVFDCALTKNGIPNDSGGIYIFVRRDFLFFLTALYVGKAANLRGRLVGHEKWGTAWWDLGATERYTMRVRSEDERRMIEEDLIRGLKPRMNDVMMPRSADDAPNTPELKRKWLWRRKVAAWFAGLFGKKPAMQKVARSQSDGEFVGPRPSPKPTVAPLARARKGHGPEDHTGYWRKSA